MSILLPCRSGNLVFFRFPTLTNDNLQHGVFNRQGGVSSPPYDSMNVSFGVGDDPLQVRRNRAKIKEALGIDTLISARQVHGDRVLVVDAGMKEDFEAEGYDALVTRDNSGLMIQQADCQAVIIFDPETPAVGLAHVGWRGSVAGIVRSTVLTMASVFGSTPAQLRAAISPSLGPCCAEFRDFRRDLPLWMHGFQVRPNYFDFPAITIHQLQQAGLLRENISSSRVCTRCNPDYFSYRRSVVTGRFATLVTLSGRA